MTRLFQTELPKIIASAQADLTEDKPVAHVVIKLSGGLNAETVAGVYICYAGNHNLDDGINFYNHLTDYETIDNAALFMVHKDGYINHSRDIA